MASGISPDVRATVAQIDSPLPTKPIKSLNIVPVDSSAQGGDLHIIYSDGSTQRVSTAGQAQAVQLAPDGQTFGFNLVAYYVDTKGDLWIQTKAIVLYRGGKRVAVIEPEKQATVGWAFRDGSSSIMVSAQGTHGPIYLGLYDVATGKKKAEAFEFDEGPKPKWTQGAPLLYCCTVKTTVAPYTQK
ncbi:MAG: hypothetical protein JNJ46_01525 [Myxococcales bacterium]|nr:hypothetical protein [Myxococcales bacterium]